PNLPNYLGIPP
uniref:Bradykinin-potentiating peptide Cdc n=1 Tax=Crotalus durissus terrificus TaxID=8732 RepID=BPP_CRODU